MRVWHVLAAVAPDIGRRSGLRREPPRPTRPRSGRGGGRGGGGVGLPPRQCRREAGRRDAVLRIVQQEPYRRNLKGLGEGRVENDDKGDFEFDY